MLYGNEVSKEHLLAGIYGRQGNLLQVLHVTSRNMNNKTKRKVIYGNMRTNSTTICRVSVVLIVSSCSSSN